MSAPPLTGLDDLFRRTLPELGTDWQPVAVPSPELVVINEPLAREIGLDPDQLRSADGIAVLAGNSVPDGSSPIAMGYAGHQFGGYSPRLGDGRALLLGELIAADGARLDVHLKGSGRTPYARGGDGKAALGPMLREYVIAEAMHALGIPTARALAVVGTGERIARAEGPVPGGVLTRVATSHIRVGTFEYAARIAAEQASATTTAADGADGKDGADADGLGVAEAANASVLNRLARHSIDRHYPAAADAENPFVAFLDAVIDAQASLIVKWMNVGFIHGVMNTDNMTISGETIDYGPCAFMDSFSPSTVFSSIDHQGRYAFGNQPPIGLWNLTRLAETLIPLIDADDDEAAIEIAKERLETYSERFSHHWMGGMRDKLGLGESSDDESIGDGALFTGLLQVMETDGADFTNTFRALATSLRGNEADLEAQLPSAAERDAWVANWRRRLDTEGRDLSQVATAMDRVNPLYVPRNHLVEEALAAAELGMFQPFEELLERTTNPYEEVPGADRFTQPAPEDFTDGYQTFCGT